MGHSNSSSIAELNMNSFVAILACVASASAGVVPAGYAYPAAYGYTAAAPVAAATYAAGPYAYGYAAQPVAYAHAPVAGVYAGHYDPSVAYANLYLLLSHTLMSRLRLSLMSMRKLLLSLTLMP